MSQLAHGRLNNCTATRLNVEISTHAMSLSFAIGKPPSNSLIEAESGWSRVPGYDDSMPATLKAIGLGLAAATALAVAWRLLVPDGLPLEARPAKQSIVFAFLIPTLGHELCHMLLFPRMGFLNTTVGLWPKMGALYVQYMQPVTRSRFIVATLSPTILLCLVPLLFGILGVAVPAYLQWATILNGVAVGSDLLAVVQLMRFGSATALVLDSNHALFLREPENDA